MEPVHDIRFQRGLASDGSAKSDGVPAFLAGIATVRCPWTLKSSVLDQPDAGPTMQALSFWIRASMNAGAQGASRPRTGPESTWIDPDVRRSSPNLLCPTTADRGPV